MLNAITTTIFYALLVVTFVSWCLIPIDIGLIKNSLYARNKEFAELNKTMKDISDTMHDIKIILDNHDN